VQNEAEEAVAHRVVYDVDALATVAARAAASKACIRVDALPGGMHNKVLMLTMDDGKQVIAKLPYPVAGQRHFTTASEVATMDWLRTSTTTPVPKVLAWCSRAETTPVKAEYIIMEKACGVPLKTK
jgi:fructosamine-3-kinase